MKKLINKSYSKAPYILFIIASILVILRGLFSLTIFLVSQFIPFLNEIFSLMGKNTLYLSAIFSIIGISLGFILIKLASKIKDKYESKSFYYIGLILAGFVLAEFSTEAILVLIGLLIGIIKYEPRENSIIMLSKLAIITGFFSIVHFIVKYLITKDMMGTLGSKFGSFFIYLSLSSLILGLILLPISIILYNKTKNKPSRGVYIVSIILGILGICSSMGNGGILLLTAGILGLKSLGNNKK